MRVAIYTRKSTDEGLDEEFSSIDAQRAAAESFLESQRSQGWILLPERYDDGGFTGASLERPAFKRLLADVESKKVDLVLVHRLDRLSRSLLHFLQVMERFEGLGVSFLSVTQPLFNTASSSGRLMLNVLMSFAAYERELIAERTAGKLRAARERGLFTGGVPILGYGLEGKRLAVRPAEADLVREIFTLFIELRSASRVARELARRGLRMRSWRTEKGRVIPERSFSQTQVARILRNPTYIGKVAHAGKLHEGVHEPLIDRKTWERTTRIIEERRKDLRRPRGSKLPVPLRKLLRCGACGRAMSPSYAAKRGRRYYYYACLTILKHGASACPGSRVQAGLIEGAVADELKRLAADPERLDRALEPADRARQSALERARGEAKRLEEEAARLKAQSRRLARALERGAPPRAALERLRELEEALDANEKLKGDLRAEAERLEGAAVDPRMLGEELLVLAAQWDELPAEERAGWLSRVLDEVLYDARSGEVALRFRARPAGDARETA